MNQPQTQAPRRVRPKPRMVEVKSVERLTPGCVRVTLTAYFIAACARALRTHPLVNASFHEDAMELHADCNIGVGTALGNDGLIVPVIHRAQELAHIEVARRLGQVLADARGGRLDPHRLHSDGGGERLSRHSCHLFALC